MNSSRVGDTLSKRLSKLKSYYENEDNIWDIGCDHGQLGLSFQSTQSVKSINLVDPAGPVIDVLRDKLKTSDIPKASLYHKKGQEISIDSLSNCIFIAGMGGKEIGEIILHLLTKLDPSSKIVISPHRKILELRSLLNELPLILLREEIMEEDGQFYQILSLRPGNAGVKVSLYGDDIWSGTVGLAYLNQQLMNFEVHRDEASQKYVSYLKVRKALKC